ncbi:chemotaxis protein CheB [Pelagicoccus sp. SDUM812003]|uniref:chemotaxis protein CheB n=1 Tax=Pelagicoccus sp. SDUM812003 TaxID=3041267 RepID=UPI00280D904E|nr:chemotaxis protein CheB [Pelagicoccus sp. SDUM812003]MDQ8204014.1 chemotaxis protein CheB [Pelagicoccus sp. SDUM812003]
MTSSEKVRSSSSVAKRAPGSAPARPESQCVVVGVGASAGGLSAFKQFLEALPSDTGMAFVLIQHLDPNHESMMADLLSKSTKMPVVPAEHAMTIEPDRVYMIPPNRFLSMRDGGLFLEQPVKRRGIRMPIDHFFRSLAEQRRELAVGVVLSGTGGDGARGLREIKAHGGMIMVQDPKTAEYDGMPRSAIATGLVDYELPISKMPDVIAQYVRHPYVEGREKGSEDFQGSADDYKSIVSLLKAHTDYDFRCYKQGTLIRRIQRRMGLHQLRRVEDYLKLLQEDREEMRQLFRDLLISVTAFFREPESWKALESEVVARIVQEKRDHSTVRVWVPGCATGEEAYSLGIAFFDEFERQGKSLTLQLFGTDLDEDAIAKARQAVYPASIGDDVPSKRLEKHFSKTEDGRYLVNKRLRESMVFASQNVIADPPFSKLDLVSCRNLLIYLEPHVQQRLFRMFHFALNKDRYLFLGQSESLGREARLFDEVSKQWRIFRKKGSIDLGALRTPVSGNVNTMKEESTPNLGSGPVSPVERSKKLLLERFAPACVVVDRNFDIQYQQGPVKDYFEFPSGEPTRNLMSICAEGLRSSLRRGIARALQKSEMIADVAPKVRRGDQQVSVSFSVEAVPADKASEQLYIIAFHDTMAALPPGGMALSSLAEGESGGDAEGSEAEGARREGDGSDGRLARRRLERELQAVREDLQRSVEEFETSNEELKASNEEVMSMNEELQSTNEEFETSREELQSLNEELSTVNNQLEDKIQQLEDANNDLSNLLSSTEIATLFLDTNFRIRRYTPVTSNLLHVIETDIGRPVSDLASSFDDANLYSDAREVLEKLMPIEREVYVTLRDEASGVVSGPNPEPQVPVEERRNCFIRRILPYRTSDNKIDGVVVTYTNITRLRESLSLLERRERQAAVVAQIGKAALAGSSRNELFKLTVEGLKDALNGDFVKILQYRPNEDKLLLKEGIGWRMGLVGKAKVDTGVSSQAGYTLQTNAPVLVDNLETEKRFRGPELLTSHGVKSGISVVIGKLDNPWGILATHSKESGQYSLDDAYFVQALANILWEAIERYQTRDRLTRRLTEIDSIYESAPVGLCLLDTDLRFVRINDLLARINGRSVDEHIGRSVEEILPEMAETLVPILKRILEGGEPVIGMELSISSAAGQKGDYLANYYPFRSGGEIVGVNCVVQDVSSRKRSEDALRQSNERLELAWDATTGGVVEHNVPLDSSPILSPQVARMLGYELDDIPSSLGILEWIRNRVHPENLDTTEKAYANFLLGTDDRLVLETRMRHASGRWIWIHASFKAVERREDGAPARVIGMLLDMSELKEAENVVRESEERLRIARDAARIGIHVYDIKSNHVKWDDRVRELWGIDRDEEITYQTFEAGLHPDDRERTNACVKAALDPDTGGHLEVEYRVVNRKDRKTRWIAATGEVFFERGEAVRMVGTVQDISVQKETEEKLRRADRRKDEFLAVLAHELRNPMAVLSSGLNVMKLAKGDEDLVSETHGIMERQVGQLTNLVNDLLDVARYERDKLNLQMKLTSISEVISEATDSTFHLFQEKKHSLKVTLPKKPVYVMADPGRMCQVVSNLLTNAAKFTRDAGEIEVAVSARGGKSVKIRVKDNGVGLSRQAKEKIFDMFAQVEEGSEGKTAGLGIGLTLVKGLVEKHGGTIEVDSPGRNKGSVFTVSLPIVERKTEAGLEKNRSPGRSENSKPFKILIVDDNEAALKTMSTLLSLKGHEVRTAGDGKSALLLAPRFKPDVIVMDIDMPKMNGHQAARELRQQKWSSKVCLVAHSGLGRQSDKAAAQSSGFDCHLTKPATVEHLEEVLAIAAKKRSG